MRPGRRPAGGTARGRPHLLASLHIGSAGKQSEMLGFLRRSQRRQTLSLSALGWGVFSSTLTHHHAWRRGGEILDLGFGLRKPAIGRRLGKLASPVHPRRPRFPAALERDAASACERIKDLANLRRGGGGLCSKIRCVSSHRTSGAGVYMAKNKGVGS